MILDDLSRKRGNKAITMLHPLVHSIAQAAAPIRPQLSLASGFPRLYYKLVAHHLQILSARQRSDIPRFGSDVVNDWRFQPWYLISSVV